MITDAEWIDINGDGWPDFVVAGEWMSIKILINERGKFMKSTKECGLKWIYWFMVIFKDRRYRW